MTPPPLVSIIMPVYNGAPYLREAIESALAQTHAHREIIVINDGSSDNGATEAIALSYGTQVRYLAKPNGGVASALNYGINAMKGKYFSWLSHDDVYYPSKLAEQVAYLEDPANNADIVYSNYQLINGNSEPIGDVILDHSLLTRVPYYGILRGAIHGCALLVPRRCFLETGLFDENLPTTQDYTLWFAFLRRYRFVHLPRVLIRSRCHDLQDSKKHPGHTKACNDLWLNMMGSMSLEQILQCEPSAYAFFAGMAAFLQTTPFQEAYAFAEAKAARELALLPAPFRERYVGGVHRPRLDVRAPVSVPRPIGRATALVCRGWRALRDRGMIFTAIKSMKTLRAMSRRRMP